MLIDGKWTCSVWIEPDGWSIGIIDQTKLPHVVDTLRLATLADAVHAISSMQTRGAPMIGVVAAYGLCLALRADASDAGMGQAYAMLLSTRPTAVNLKWALDEVVAAVRNRPRSERVAAAYARAAAICREDIADNEAIGRHGLAVIEGVAAAKPPGGRVNLRCTGCWKKPARSPRQRNLCSTASPTPSKKGFIALQRLRPPPIRKSLRHCQ